MADEKFERWIDIPCPRCQEPIQRVNGAVVRWMRLMDVKCECGFSEDFEWVNPSFQSWAGRVDVQR